MKLQKILGTFLITVVLCVSCKTPDPPYVDTKANVYKQLSTKYNGAMDSLIKKVANIKAFQELEKPVKVVAAKDEMQMIAEVINVSINGKINMDSLGMTKNNSMIFKNNNNVSVYSFTKAKNLTSKKGYNVALIGDSYTSRDIKSAWNYALGNYQKRKNDSITQNHKQMLESKYENYVNIINNLKYVVLEEDKLLIPPVLDLEQNGFMSGYIITHLFVFDINTLEQVAQTMVISTNSDEVRYMSLSKSSPIDKFKVATLKNQLKSNLLIQKSKTVDSIFLFNNIQLLR